MPLPPPDPSVQVELKHGYPDDMRGIEDVFIITLKG